MTAQEMKNAFIEVLKEENKAFSNFDATRPNAVILSCRGENLESFSICVTFVSNPDGASTAIVNCFDLPNLARHVDAGLRAVNKLNDDEMVKYYIDPRGDVIASSATVFNAYGISNGFSAHQVLASATIMALSIDTAYLSLSKIAAF